MTIEMPDVKKAMRLAFGKCPDCNEPMVGGRWLRWCPDRKCGWVGPRRETQDLDV